MELLLGIFVFFAFIVAALKIGAVMFKILFTILGAVVGLGLLVVLLPLGLGLLTILLIPAIIIGVIFAIFKCIMVIF
ncbi:hypothetical protein [Sedimentibacter sp. MB31-C6]|uniref:hypothetical protein n=1 Tax=Sedimentibacter sp. MB31-C6 TaxID=3109366 RepID=UPI002DDD7A68|nr:hypothetical protein [Sedimentibacter sp. MB36-C1]WSI05027.1 hypothetical protein U8307_04325 [Sedimentibacter sp. MB36-C1]